MKICIRNVVLFLLVVIPFSGADAQTITWTDVSSQYTLPEGVKLIKGERASPLLKCWYYDVDLNNAKIAVRAYVGTNANVPTLTTRFGAYAAINGGFFGGGSSLSTVVYPGEVKAQNVTALTRNSMSYPVIRSFFGVKKDRSLCVEWIYHFGSTTNDIYSFSAPLPYTSNDPVPRPAPLKSNGTQMTNLLTGIGGAPVLIKNGVVNITYNEELMWGSGVGWTNSDPRTAVAYTADKHVLLFVADGRSAASAGISLTEMANVFLGLGCVEALNLDGGGSTQMSLGNSFINTPSENRAVSTILAIVHPDSVKFPEEPISEKIIDTEDSAVTLAGQGWFATANAGYYGSSKAMLNPIGDGSSYASYKTNLSQAGKYRLYGWWVVSSNRASDTPYIINHSGKSDTVKMDQTKNGSAWTLLGTYEFNGDTTESVVISNKATKNNYIVADAIKLSLMQTTAVDEDNINSVPGKFTMEQNYPNPFNPSTVINFNTKEPGNVTLKVYDLLGREVRTLINGFRNAGNYSASFDATGLNSGVYFYRLQSGGSFSVKKMIFAK